MSEHRPSHPSPFTLDVRPNVAAAPAPGGAFRAVPRTGVIFVTEEALARGYGVEYRRAADAAAVGVLLEEAIAGLGANSTLIELQAELLAPPQSV